MTIIKRRFSHFLVLIAAAILLLLNAGKALAFSPTECAADRFGSSLNCTANDVHITNISIVNGPSSCVGGTTFQADVNITVNFNSDTRYGIGIFLSDDGKNPQITSANGGSAFCSVAILTDPPFPEFDSDICADGSKTTVPVGCSGTACTGTATQFVHNATLYCNAANGTLSIPYVVSWDNQSWGSCNSIDDPVPNTTSKCNTGTVAVAYGSGTITVLPSITKTNPSTYALPGDSTTYTVTIANNSGDSSNGVVFTDPAVADLAVNSLSCLAAGGAACPSPLNISDMQGAGITLPAMPGGSSLTFTIDATVSAAYPAPGIINNTAYVALNGQANSATNSLEIRSKLIATKSFLPASIGAGGTSALAVSLQNTNPDNTTGVSFGDVYPANLANTGFANATISGTGCTGTLEGANNGTSLSLLNGTVPANTTCTYTVNVTSSIANAAGYNNSTGDITTANAGPTSAATATLIVLDHPTVAKSFSPVSVGVNSPSVLTITLTNPNPAIINGAAFTDTYPANMLNTNTPNGTTTCPGGTVTAASNGGSLSLTGGTIPANSSCTVTVNVTGAVVGTYTNNTGSITTANAGMGASASAVLMVVIGENISGSVYNDANHNSALDSGEGGTGQAVYVKLASYSGGSCANTAVSATPADPSSGQYTISGVSSGSYCLILSTNSTLSITTVSDPAGWLGTEAAGGIRTVSVANNSISQQDFGLYYGTTISGEVFSDTGNGGGVANDGKLDGGEAGLSGAAMKLTDDSTGTVYDSMTTGANGLYNLYIPGTITSGTYIKVTETNPSEYISTGADPGNTGGVYDRPSGTIRFSLSPDTVYIGVNYGDVPANQFLNDGSQTGAPGTTLFYSHTYTAGSAGLLSFSTSAVSSPSISGWSEVLYQDTACTGQYASGDPQVTAPVSASAGQKVCILLKEFIPATAPLNAQNDVTVTAQLSYSNASPALTNTETRTDLTTVGAGGLALTKTVDKSSVPPGGILTYTITYTNQSAYPLSNIVINDATPAYTVFQSASCGTLGGGLSGCIVSPPAVGGTGAISWTLSGTLTSGSSGTVVYTVQVQNW